MGVIGFFRRRTVSETNPWSNAGGVRVAVIDVGSNNARLLVTEQTARGDVRRIGAAKAALGLGAEIARQGEVSPSKLFATAKETARLAAIARELGAETMDVLVTAPAHQAANADELVATVTHATRQAARVLSSDEERTLAYEGAIATMPTVEGPVAVCDVGSAATVISIGDRARGAIWTGRIELAASRLLRNPPARKQLAEAEALANSRLADVRLPQVAAALAVGGSARSLAQLAGRRLDEAALDRALAHVASQPFADDELRSAASLAAGAIVLRALTRKLETPLQLACGGLRHGATARLLDARQAA